MSLWNFYESLCSKYQLNLGASMRESYFVFDSVQLMYYICHRVNFIRGGSNNDFTDWIKKKKVQKTINQQQIEKNTGDKCFQYAAAVALNYEEIQSHPERVSSIKSFINKYN